METKVCAWNPFHKNHKFEKSETVFSSLFGRFTIYKCIKCGDIRVKFPNKNENTKRKDS